jgi:tape measure domain-containing protein
MSSLGDLFITVGAKIDGFKAAMREVDTSLDDIGGKMKSVGAALTVGITAPLTALGVGALKAAGELEQTSVAFTTLLKSADAAKQHIADLKQFALQTPFQFEDLTKASRLMQAFGTSAGEVVPRLRVIGNAVSALGGGNDLLERVVRSIGEIGTRGKISGEQLRELSRAGIPAIEALATKMGVTQEKAQQMVTAGLVNAKTATDALMEYMERRFKGGMEAQSQTLLGMWSNVKDKMQFTMAAIGDALSPLAKSAIEKFIDPILGKVKDMAEGFKSLPQPIQAAVIGFGVFSAALPVATVAMGLLITNSITIFSTFSKLAPLVGGPLMNAFRIAVLYIGSMNTASLAYAAGGAVAMIGAITTLIYLQSQLNDEQAKTDAQREQSAKLMARVEEEVKKRGLNIVQLRKKYDEEMAKIKALPEQDMFNSGGISQEARTSKLEAATRRYSDALGELLRNYVATHGAAQQVLSVQAALEKLNLKSTEDRKKELAEAKEAYAVLLSKGSENAEVLAEALLRVKAAEEAVFGKVETKTVTEHFKAIRNELDATALLVDRFNADVARQKQLFKELSSSAGFDGMGGVRFRPTAMIQIASDEMRTALIEFGTLKNVVSETSTGVQELWTRMAKLPAMTKVAMIDLYAALHQNDISGILDTPAMGEMERNMKGIVAATDSALAPMQRLKEAMAAFGISSEKSDIPALTGHLKDLKDALDADEISQRVYDLAFIKYIEDLDKAGEVLDKLQIKEYEVAKARTQQLQTAKKEQNEFQREVQRAFDGMARGIARSIVDWKNFGDTVKNVGKDLAAGFLEILLKQLFKPLEEQFAKLVGKITNVLFGGGSAGGGVLGTSVGAAGGAAGTIGGAAGSGGSAAGGIAGAASSSLTGILTSAFTGITALFSGIGMFQNMHMETSLNAIEHNTRYSMMYLGERSDGGILGVLFKMSEQISWGPGSKQWRQSAT